MPNNKIELEDVLSHRNFNGEIYLSDVHFWLGEDVDIKIVRKVHKKLNEIANYVPPPRIPREDKLF